MKREALNKKLFDEKVARLNKRIEENYIAKFGQPKVSKHPAIHKEKEMAQDLTKDKPFHYLTRSELLEWQQYCDNNLLSYFKRLYCELFPYRLVVKMQARSLALRF